MYNPRKYDIDDLVHMGMCMFWVCLKLCSSRSLSFSQPKTSCNQSSRSLLTCVKATDYLKKEQEQAFQNVLPWLCNNRTYINTKEYLSNHYRLNFSSPFVLGVYIKEFRERLYLREGSGQSVTLYVLLFRGPGIELLAEKQNLAELSGVEFKNTLKKTTVDMKWVAVTWTWDI